MTRVHTVLGSGPAFGDVTKRELFAAMAMQGILSKAARAGMTQSEITFISKQATEFSDALLAALSDKGRS